MLLPQLPGVYTLLVSLGHPLIVKPGSLSTLMLKKAEYCYIGSALNGLHRRLKHHLSPKKRLHWHIDYLLKSAQVSTIYWANTTTPTECLLADGLVQLGLPSIPGFGSTDCRCESHLFFSHTRNVIPACLNRTFGSLGLKLSKFSPTKKSSHRPSPKTRVHLPS